MPEGLEIERKFLVELPDLKKLDLKRTVSIIQTYLTNGAGDSQRRVRRIAENGRISYTYTEKVFIDDVTRREDERSVSEKEYGLLLEQRRTDCVPIVKVRHCFLYREQLFELDTYPFSDTLAVMELELEEPSQKIFFPDNVKVIKEITGDKRYSNAALANAGTFPEKISVAAQNGVV
ncbi:CYTH domain-containing protein [Ruminococcus sp. XPD3002]|uniref:CYTH domain-containing protein n=1 Tax=Ruminococcus sp. XPD3002 TaxID=1452269 RepID=UPI00091E9F75|nr:CYTH domain-containing protein [Ruminococcus flavefaciens]